MVFDLAFARRWPGAAVNRDFASLSALVALGFRVRAPAVVLRAWLQRGHDLCSMGLGGVGRSAGRGTIGLLLACFGHGPSSLVWQGLAHAAVTSSWFWVSSTWRPSWHFSFNSIRSMWGFGLHLPGSNSLLYWVRHFDNLLVGKFLGSAALGIYTRAYSVMLLPAAQLNQFLTLVMFPTLSKIQEDRDRVKSIYLSLVGGALTFVAVWIGLKWGVVGVAAAYLARVALTIYPSFAIPGRLIGMRFTVVVRAVAAPLFCSILTALVAFGVDEFWLTDRVPALLRLAVMALAGGVVYLALMEAGRPRAYSELRALAPSRLLPRLAGKVEA